MKTIGFIDYYIDEWHANNYPAMIRDKAGEEFQVKYAYGMIEKDGLLTNKQWGEKNGIEMLDSAEAVAEKSDFLIVLSPDNPEMHVLLSEAALRSGKHTYIDKTFADSKENALKIFEMADKYGTKCYSSSALRFSKELAAFDRNGIETVVSQGPGTFEVYSIHQIEPIVKLMNVPAASVMCMNGGQFPSMSIEFADGRIAQMSQMGKEAPFTLNVGYTNGKAEYKEIKSDFFGLFIDGLIDFFKTGEIKAEHEQTINIISIRESGLKALNKPFTKVNV